MTGTPAATPLVKTLAGSLTMTGRRGPERPGWAACSAGWLSTAHLLQPAVSMTKLLEIYYPNLTKNRIRVGSGNEDERRSPAALHPKIAREFVTRTGKIGRLRGSRPRLRRSLTTDGRGGWRP